MLSRKNLKKKFSLLKQESNLDFLITTFFISLLTILGFFVSYKNKDKFIDEMKYFNTVIISTNPADNAVSGVSN